ncbi:MAG UNVERIFIED_CONTAM: hypothetical protein LVQ98_03390 [Rickettsiaceae bacterium]|jgi:hypothetical protein
MLFFLPHLCIYRKWHPHEDHLEEVGRNEIWKEFRPDLIEGHIKNGKIISNRYNGGLVWLL